MLNIKEYIESGVLELYVMGKLSEAEKREVEQNMAQYPEVKAEVERIEAAMEDYALMHQRSPIIGAIMQNQKNTSIKPYNISSQLN